MTTNEREKVHLKDLLHFSPKQDEARKAALQHRYTLYGGAMAGGKSYWLRWMLVCLLVRWASQGHRNVEVGLFCEDYPTLKDRQLSKIGSEFPSWLGQLHGDHAQHGRCYILAEEYGGGIIKFRNLDDPSKYQSAEFAAIAVDELTKNTREVFDDLRNRLRWPGITDIRFLGATNPGGIGHAWVKKAWLDRIFDENETEPEEFHYVRALAQDNPHIDKSYLKQLESLPADKRRAYLEGDWDIFKGQYFHEFRRELHVVKPFEIPSEWKCFCMGDYGQTNPSAVYWGAVSPEGQLYLYRELHKPGYNYSDLGKELAALTPPNEKIDYWVWDPALWSKEPASSSPLTGIEIITAAYKEAAGKPMFAVKGTNDRIIGWGQVREYLKPYQRQDDVTAKLQIFDTCQELIRTLPSLIYDEHRVEDVDTDGEDHAADACFIAGTMIATEFGLKPIEAITLADRVLTRVGYRRVLAVFSNGTKDTVSVAGLTGTPNHPVWVEDKGFVPLSTLRYGDIIRTCTPISTGASLVRYGLNILARYLKAMTSTTKTLIPKTTILAISNVFQLLNTNGFIGHLNPSSPVSALFVPLVLIRRYFTPVFALTTANRSSGETLAPTLLSAPVSAALHCLSATNMSRPDFAERNATPVDTSARPSVRAVDSALSHSPRKSHGLFGVASVAENPTTAGRHEVYNLSVEDVEEYFANGVLVHNCRYGIMSRPQPNMTAKEKEVLEWKLAMKRKQRSGGALKFIR